MAIGKASFGAKKSQPKEWIFTVIGFGFSVSSSATLFGRAQLQTIIKISLGLPTCM